MCPYPTTRKQVLGSRRSRRGHRACGTSGRLRTEGSRRRPISRVAGGRRSRASGRGSPMCPSLWWICRSDSTTPPRSPLASVTRQCSSSSSSNRPPLPPRGKTALRSFSAARGRGGGGDGVRDPRGACWDAAAGEGGQGGCLREVQEPRAANGGYGAARRQGVCVCVWYWAVTLQAMCVCGGRQVLSLGVWVAAVGDVMCTGGSGCLTSNH
mmetsp:Transcript_32390/g.75431  ORF Transcript_32390/g.75431 Transcript_32390/m.75431 type:complete len:211 (+) Transcript_32390:688-1320(+)